MTSTVDTIPVARFAEFGAGPHSCAVWWSPADSEVLGLYAALPHPIDTRSRQAIHQLLACRPQLDDLRTGQCACDRPCTSIVMALIYRAVPDACLTVCVDHGHPTHPGDAYLHDLRDLWAHDRMGWT